MKKVQVIAPGGATLNGPCRVKLTRDQHARRAHVLGPVRKNGVYDVNGDQALSFKMGEMIAVDDLPKLSRAHFEECGKGRVTAPEPGTGKGAVVAPDVTKDTGGGAGAEGGGGDDAGTEGGGDDADGGVQ